MAKHQVFLVHGMGDFNKDWSLDTQQTLRTAFAQYDRVKAMGLLGHFDFVEINYNDIFESIRAQWQANATAAAGALSAVGLAGSAASRLVDLANAGTGGDFFRTHVLDVVLYRFMKPITERVTQSVRSQILNRLKAFPQDDAPSWSVIGHSLGTAVVQDTLHAMFTETVDGVLLGDKFKPDFVFMVANVSKVLWNRGGDIYASALRPHTVDSLGLCWKYCSFSHELDPFPQVDPFDPPVSWFPEGATPVQREQLYFGETPTIRAQDVQDINVHGFNHYLSHPAVHSEIINTLVGLEVVRPADVTKALQAWRANTLVGNELKSARDLLRGLALGETDDWRAIVDALAKFRFAVQKLSALKEGEG
jgi:hypothetical protein